MPRCSLIRFVARSEQHARVGGLVGQRALVEASEYAHLKAGAEL